MAEKFSDYGINVGARTTGQVKTFCPKCRDKRSNKADKSLSVNIAEGVWDCHYCGWTGVIRNENFVPKKTYARPPQRVNKTTLSDKVVKYFEGRKISQDTLTKLYVGEGKEWMPQTGKLENTIQWPYFRSGELINIKYRDARKNFKMYKDAELAFYNIDSLGKHDYCIITEGEMDALSYIEAGYTPVISVPNGGKSYDFIDSCYEDIDRMGKIYLATDNDKVGLEMRAELIRRFGAERCFLVTYPDGSKDGNEYLQKHGKNALALTIPDAQPVPIEGVLTFSDYEPQLDELYHNGLQRGATIGHEEFDKLISFLAGRLMIVTGIPGSGKSELIDEICVRLNMLHRWKVGYFSPENFPVEFHVSKLIEKITGARFSKQSLNESIYAAAKEYVADNFNFIFPKDESCTLDLVLDKARYLVRRKGIKVLVIDPYNRLEHHIKTGVNESTYISGQLDKMTAFAQREGVLLILMAHPRKMERDDMTEYKVPTLYDINGSANFFNKADYGLCVHRIRKQNLTQVHIQKVKFKHLGEPGVANFRYNLNNGRYVPAIDPGNPDERPIYDNANYLTGSIGERLVPKQQNLPIGKDLAVGAERNNDFLHGGISAEDTPF